MANKLTDEPAFFSFSEDESTRVLLKGYANPDTDHEVYWIDVDKEKAAAAGYTAITNYAPIYVNSEPTAGTVPLFLYVQDPNAIIGKPIEPLPSPPPPRDLDLQTLRGRLLSDQYTDQDLLGFSVYSAAIAELIRTNVIENQTVNPESDSLESTQEEAQVKEKNQVEFVDKKLGKPFNIGIIAPWGHGKTTLMRSIQEELDLDFIHLDEIKKEEILNRSKKPSNKETSYSRMWRNLHGVFNPKKPLLESEFPSVWFNAWRYQSSQQIWAGLGHAIISQLSDRLNPADREMFWMQLQMSRVNVQKMKLNFYSDLIKKILPWIIGAVAVGIITSSVGVLKNFFPGFLFPGICSSLITFVGIVKALPSKIDGASKVYLDEPDYNSQLGVYHDIIEDLHKVFSIMLDDNQRVVIFIDDLDRCSPTVIGDVFEAVNLMMVDPIIGKHCYFIFGMDAQVVAGALDKRYENLSGKLRQQEQEHGSVGWYFLDKFIQLPFNIPIMTREERLNFLKHYFEPGSPKVVVDKSKEAIKEKTEEVKQVMKEPDPVTKKELLKGVLNDKNAGASVIKEGVKEAVKQKLKEEDSGMITKQLKFISPFLSSSPREIIRYINLLRFFNTALYIRHILHDDIQQVQFKGVAKYLLITLKWPQLVRWIQWEGEDDLVLYNTTSDKAAFLDGCVSGFCNIHKDQFNSYSSLKEKQDDLKENDFGIAAEALYKSWSTHINTLVPLNGDKVHKLPWLFDKQLMEVLVNSDTQDATFIKALSSKMW